MSARDELARDWEAAYVAEAPVVDFLLAAGWRKPRTITTVEDLAELKQGAAVLTANGYVYIAERYERRGAYPILWKGLGVGSFSALWFEKSGSFPATVLFEPETS